MDFKLLLDGLVLTNRGQTINALTEPQKYPYVYESKLIEDNCH